MQSTNTACIIEEEGDGSTTYSLFLKSSFQLLQFWQFFGHLAWHGKFQVSAPESTFQLVATWLMFLRTKQGREVLFCQCILPINQGHGAPVTVSHFLYGKSQAGRNSSNL